MVTFLQCYLVKVTISKRTETRIHCNFVISTHHRAIVRIYTAVSLLQSETFDGVVMRTHRCTDLQGCIFYLFLHLTGVLSRTQTITVATLFFSKTFKIPQPNGTPQAAYLSKSAQCQKPNYRNAVLSKPVITPSIRLTRSR